MTSTTSPSPPAPAAEGRNFLVDHRISGVTRKIEAHRRAPDPLRNITLPAHPTGAQNRRSWRALGQCPHRSASSCRTNRTPSRSPLASYQSQYPRRRSRHIVRQAGPAGAPRVRRATCSPGFGAWRVRVPDTLRSCGEGDVVGCAGKSQFGAITFDGVARRSPKPKAKPRHSTADRIPTTSRIPAVPISGISGSNTESPSSGATEAAPWTAPTTAPRRPSSTDATASAGIPGASHPMPAPISNRPGITSKTPDAKANMARPAAIVEKVIEMITLQEYRAEALPKIAENTAAIRELPIISMATFEVPPRPTVARWKET
jgi:hypothetical protein